MVTVITLTESQKFVHRRSVLGNEYSLVYFRIMSSKYCTNLGVNPGNMWDFLVSRGGELYYSQPHKITTQSAKVEMSRVDAVKSITFHIIYLCF